MEQNFTTKKKNPYLSPQVHYSRYNIKINLLNDSYHAKIDDGENNFSSDVTGDTEELEKHQSWSTIYGR